MANGAILGEIANATPELIETENTPYGVKFTTNGFSPFVLMWDKPSGPGADTKPSGPGADTKPSGPGADTKPSGTGEQTPSRLDREQTPSLHNLQSRRPVPAS